VIQLVVHAMVAVQTLAQELVNAMLDTLAMIVRSSSQLITQLMQMHRALALLQEFLLVSSLL
jgi:hypothetical protein